MSISESCTYIFHSFISFLSLSSSLYVYNNFSVFSIFTFDYSYFFHLYFITTSFPSLFLFLFLIFCSLLYSPLFLFPNFSSTLLLIPPSFASRY